MFGDLKNIIIAVAITAVVVGFASSSITWKYTSSHYKEIIATAKEEAATALQNATDKVLLAERKNNDITAELNKRALEQDKVVADLQTKLSQYRFGGTGVVRVIAKCDSSKATVADTASSSSQATSPTDSNGVCELPKLLTDTIIETARAADEMRGRLDTCRLYAEAIDVQREEMSNQ